jgi:regulator of PEP synthase PpsR (kinase-PPPase family)
VLQEIDGAPGVVLHTIVDANLRAALEQGCRDLDLTCVAALDPLVAALARYLGASLSTRVGAQHAMDNDYFNRMDALSYAIGHDDGQGSQDLEAADVVLVGVSRTSKTPTSIYLAHRGIRAANVPLVPGAEPPAQLFTLKRAVVVGLTVSPDRLIQIRRNRLLNLREERESAYIELESVRDEIVKARRMFEKYGWPVIDVTRRSIEETAATVLQLMDAWHERRAAEQSSAP